MYEKISEIPIREEKIRKLKEKIFSEIENYSMRMKERMKLYFINNEEDSDEWNFMITEEFALLRLKEFVESKGAFQSFEARYEDKDIIIYQVSDKTLNIWLQDDYDFTLSFLCKVEHEGYCDVYEILNNRYFGYHFTNIFDKIHYDDRMKNSN